VGGSVEERRKLELAVTSGSTKTISTAGSRKRETSEPIEIGESCSRLLSRPVICPSCGDEFREGIAQCPDCRLALLDELPPETPPRLAILETTEDPDRLAVLLEKLETALVPYVVEAGTALSMLDDESTPDLSAPEPWQARIWVPGSSATRAAEAIAQATEDSSEGEPREMETLDAQDLKNPVQPR
jgi:hypothetical protein